MSLFSRNYTDMCEQFLKVLINVKDSGLVGPKSYITHDRTYVYPKHVFEETIELPFEDRMMPCPKGYDELLRQEYGDYMTPVKGTSWHTMTIVDTEESYIEKIRKGELKV